MTATELHRLQKRAEELDGRPVPGLRMTEEEFEQWLDEDIRAEWVDGDVIVMSPANIPHIKLNFFLIRVVGDFVEHHDLGEIVGIESQIRLPSLKRRRNPDLLFITKSRRRIIHKTYIDGPPDLIMEIVSPDSESRDWRDKYIDYEAAGVREYWIIDPQSQRLEVYALGRNKRYRRLEEETGRVASKVLRGFYLRPEWMWKSPRPKVAAVLKELRVR